jgi:3-phenylpropionate/cinnamic acid dioxygenase small subunit
MSRPAPLVAQDYTDIQDLYAYYTLCSDAGDADGFVSCFSVDAELCIPTLSMSVRGHADLHRFKSGDKARRKGRVRRHWNSGLHLEHIDPTTVRGQCYLHAYEAAPGQALVLVDMGVYEDTLVREDGEWRFSRREIRMDHSSFTAPKSKDAN